MIDDYTCHHVHGSVNDGTQTYDCIAELFVNQGNIISAEIIHRGWDDDNPFADKLAREALSKARAVFEHTVS